MGIKPTTGDHVVIPPDNTQSRWGEWEAELDDKGEVAGEVITETWALADSANKVASKALSDAQAAIDSSGEANAELEALLDPENENSALWAIQWQINENDRLALERHQELIEASMQDIAALRETQSHSLFLNIGETSVTSRFLTLTRTSSSRVAWTVNPGWVGNVEIIAATDSYNNGFGTTVFMRKFSVPNPEFNSFSHSSSGGIGSVKATINVSPGNAKTIHFSIPDQTIGRDWQTLKSWTVPQTTQVTASSKLTFVNKTRIATYGLRIMVDNTNSTSSSASSSAPLFGHGPRSHSAALHTRTLAAGTVVSVQAKADHSNPLNREITNASFNVTWIDGTDAQEGNNG